MSLKIVCISHQIMTYGSPEDILQPLINEGYKIITHAVSLNEFDACSEYKSDHYYTLIKE